MEEDVKKNYRVFIRGCSKRVFKKHHPSTINVDGVEYSFNDYVKLIEEFKLIKVGDLIYNPYKNYFEPVKEVKFRWINTKKMYGIKRKRFPNIRFLDAVIITKTDYMIYDFDYRFISDYKDFKKAPIPETKLKVWY